MKRLALVTLFLSGCVHEKSIHAPEFSSYYKIVKVASLPSPPDSFHAYMVQYGDWKQIIVCDDESGQVIHQFDAYDRNWTAITTIGYPSGQDFDAATRKMIPQ